MPRIRPRTPVLVLPASKLPLERRRQARGRSTEALLLESARTLFGLHGYQRTSVKDVTAGAGLAVGAFYAHFGSKRDLLVALMGELLERMVTLDLHPAAGTTTHMAFRAHFQELFCDDADSFRVVRSWHEAVMTDGELAAMHAQIVRWSEKNILTLLKHLRTRPNARRDRDLAGVASLVNDYMWNLLARHTAMQRDEFERQIGTVADLLYHYVFRDRAPNQTYGEELVA